MTIITVSGSHGTGKSTYAAHLAEKLRIRHVSAGMVFRNLAKEKEMTLEELGEKALRDPSIDRLIDEKTLSEAEKGSVVIDGQLAGWVLRDKADLRIYLTAPEDIRMKRISKRDKLPLDEARRQTLARETVQRERYKIHYGFKIEDRSIYQLVLDTSIGPIESINKILLAGAEATIAGKHRERC